MREDEARAPSVRRTQSGRSKRPSTSTVRISVSYPRPRGRRESSVEETLTRGELPPQFDLDGRITTGSWREAKTSLMRTASPALPPPVLADTNDEWRSHAYCAGNPNATHVMFGHTCIYRCTSTNGAFCQSDSRVQASRKFCDSCPVRDHCLYWAVTTNLLFGVAGGLTYAERLVVRKRLKADPAGKALLRGEMELTWQP